MQAVLAGFHAGSSPGRRVFYFSFWRKFAGRLKIGVREFVLTGLESAAAIAAPFGAVDNP